MCLLWRLDFLEKNNFFSEVGLDFLEKINFFSEVVKSLLSDSKKFS